MISVKYLEQKDKIRRCSAAGVKVRHRYAISDE
jgi:hypothetical protein